MITFAAENILKIKLLKMKLQILFVCPARGVWEALCCPVRVYFFGIDLILAQNLRRLT